MKAAFLTIASSTIGLLTSTLPVRAGLGESPQECVQRYGLPVLPTARALPGIGRATEYVRGQFRIFVVFKNERAASVRYAKLDGELLTAGEMQDFMMENGGGAPWGEPQASKLTDGSPATTYRSGKRTLATCYLDKDTELSCFFFVRAAVDLPH